MGSRLDIRNEGGAALIIALGVMSILVIIGITVTALSMNSTKTVAHDIRLTEAQNIAEGGAEDTIEVTLNNYDEIYPGGVIPENYPGDGMPFYDTPQPVNDAEGNQIGTYEVWTREDPDRPGNVLITTKGTTVSGASDTSTVRVSVKFTAKIFDYALLVGDPNASYSGGMGHGSGGGCRADCTPGLELSTEDGGAIEITGNVHVNGCMYTDTDNGSHGDPGTVSFLSRDGYSDTVTYLDSFDGSALGNQPTQTDEPVEFPAVNFDSFTDTVTVDFSGGTPSGWSRHGHTYEISGADFQSNYGFYDAVVLNTGSSGRYDIKITGSGDMDNPSVITSTILVPGNSGSHGSHGNISELELKGPGLSLQPNNGIAIVSAEGKLELEDGVVVGEPGAGALIYATGQGYGHGHESEFEMEEGAVVYGSVVVSSPEVELEAEGPDGDGRSHDGRSLDGNIGIFYDSAFLSNMPNDWWSGGSITAVKENFERD